MFDPPCPALIEFINYKPLKGHVTYVRMCLSKTMSTHAQDRLVKIMKIVV